MDEKTEQLRDIFVDVADEETVTEQQKEERGSLADTDSGAVDDRLAEVIGEMRQRYGFETDCETTTLVQIVRGFYEGADDETVASELDLDPETVWIARMDLHLVGESDTDAPFELARLRDLLVEDADEESIAAELDADEETIDHYRRVAATQNRARRASQRYRTAFEEILTDADLSVRHTASVQEDGLEEATEDMEVDVSF